MYKVYNIALNENSLQIMKNWNSVGTMNKFLDKQKYKIYFEQNELDANKIMEDLFPQLEYDVFISHSHADSNYVRALKSTLENDLGLSVFVDSDVWEYADNFLSEFDQEYSKTGDATYSYNRRNNSTKHVHMMLASSLAQIMVKSEIILLFDSNNYTIEKPQGEKVTHSPWIYFEALMSNLLRIDLPNRIINQDIVMEHFRFGDSTKEVFDKEIVMNYPVDFSNLETITFSDLVKWRGECKFRKYRGKEALDYLYSIKTDKN